MGCGSADENICHTTCIHYGAHSTGVLLKIQVELFCGHASQGVDIVGLPPFSKTDTVSVASDTGGHCGLGSHS